MTFLLSGQEALVGFFLLRKKYFEREVFGYAYHGI
jgi:hypothetical protein